MSKGELSDPSKYVLMLAFKPTADPRLDSTLVELSITTPLKVGSGKLSADPHPLPEKTKHKRSAVSAISQNGLKNKSQALLLVPIVMQDEGVSCFRKPKKRGHAMHSVLFQSGHTFTSSAVCTMGIASLYCAHLRMSLCLFLPLSHHALRISQCDLVVFSCLQTSSDS